MGGDNSKECLRKRTRSLHYQQHVPAAVDNRDVKVAEGTLQSVRRWEKSLVLFKPWELDPKSIEETSE